MDFGIVFAFRAMSLCIKPCLVFSVFLLVVAIVFMVFLGDITNWKGAQYVSVCLFLKIYAKFETHLKFDCF